MNLYLTIYKWENVNVYNDLVDSATKLKFIEPSKEGGLQLGMA